MLSDVLNDVLLDILDYTRKYPFYNKFGQEIRNAVDHIIHLKGLLDAIPDEQPHKQFEHELLDFQYILYQTISNLLYLAPTMMYDGRPEMAEHSLRMANRLFDAYYNPQENDRRMGDYREPGQPEKRSETAAEENAEEMQDAAEEIDDEDGPEPMDAEQIIEERNTDRAEERADRQNLSQGHGWQPDLTEDDLHDDGAGENDKPAARQIDEGQ